MKVIKSFFRYHMGYPMTSLGDVMAYTLSMVICICVMRVLFGTNIPVLFSGLIATSTVSILLALPEKYKKDLHEQA